MAQRATIAAHSLEDVRVDLTPSRERRPPVEAPGDDLPASSSQVRKFISSPLPIQAGDTILDGFSSLRPGAKRERMVPYPIRLPAAQIAALERLRDEKGIMPAEFIRDAVAGCLALLLRS